VGKALGHKLTTSEVAKDKSGRRDRDYPCLYPSLDTLDQTSVYLSSRHPLFLIVRTPAPEHRQHQQGMLQHSSHIACTVSGLLRLCCSGH